MDIWRCFFERLHWLYVLAALFTICGVIYLSYSFLGERLPKRISQSFAFTILGGMLGIFTGILGNLLAMLLFYLSKTNINGTFDLSQSLFNSAFIGTMLGLLIGCLNEPKFQIEPSDKKNARTRKVFQRKVNWGRNILLYGVGFLLITIFSLYTLARTFDASDEVFNQITFYGSFVLISYGFLIGYLYDKTNFMWMYYILIFILLYFLFLLLILLATDYIFAFLFYFLQYIQNCILGYLIGTIFNRTRSSETSLRDTSWRRFFSYILLGIVCAIIFCIFSEWLLQSWVLTKFATGVGLLIAFGRGDGSKLVQQLKPQIKLTERGKIRLTKRSWEIFRRAFFIGSIYYLLYSLFVTISSDTGKFNDVRGITDYYLLPILGKPLFYLALLFLWLVNGIMFGALIGSIYGVGPALAIYIDNISESRMLQIGAVLTILGAITAVLPGLIS